MGVVKDLTGQEVKFLEAVLLDEDGVENEWRIEKLLLTGWGRRPRC